LSPPVTFRIEEEPSETVFLFFGDVQPEGGLDDYDVFGALLDRANKKHGEVSFGLQAGDMGNMGNADEEWDAFMERADRVFGRIPLMTAIGNHEVTPYAVMPGHKPLRYLDTFALPRNGPEGFAEEFYSFEYGPVHITVLSSNYQDPQESYSDDPTENARISDEINRWIETDLSSSDKPWRIVMMHHPIFPLVSGSMTANMQREWMPIFERTQVNLILCGHQHEFMRTKPGFHNAKEDAGGMVQIMGNASQKTYPISGSGLGYIAFEKGDTAGYHYIVATQEKLEVTAFDVSGKAFDHWESIRPNTVAAQGFK
jgi:3',5'-cyclic AMP phosphodiesterase CpdA